MHAYQLQARAPPRSTVSSAFGSSRSDRFGDAPAKLPPRRLPVYGGPNPSESTIGFGYRPEETPSANRVGTGATSVERWRYSEPGGASAARHATRRPNDYDWIASLGPARYAPEREKPIMGGRMAPRAPGYSIGGSGPQRAKYPLQGHNDLMYSLPSALDTQPSSHRANAARISFRDHERRMEARPLSTSTSRARAIELTRKAHKGETLTDDERLAIRRDVTNEHESGAASSLTFTPVGTFDRAATAASLGASRSSAFGGAVGAPRFERGRPELQRAMTASALAPPPLHGGRTGVAFRPEPAALPGPGCYETGESRLKLSRSMPAYSMTSKGSLEKRMGKTDSFPGPTTYFQTPKAARAA